MQLPALRTRPVELNATGEDQVHPTLERWTRILDEAFRIPGTSRRIGIDGLLGMIPGLGDAVTLLMAHFMLREAQRLGVPRSVRNRMIWNYALDFGIGLVPFIGDLFDFAFKANRRNLDLVQDHLARNADRRAPKRVP